MKTLTEARAYAKQRKRKNRDVPLYIMKNETNFNVAYGEEDMKYGMELGFKVVEKV